MAKEAKQETNKGPTAVFYCACPSVDQDRRYGEGKRLCNRTAKGYRCTVCGKDR